MHIVIDSINLCKETPHRPGYLGEGQIQRKYFKQLTDKSEVLAFQWFPFPVAEAFGVFDAPNPTLAMESFIKIYKYKT